MTPWPNPADWQPMLDRHGNLFGNLRSGSRIGIARRDDVTQQGAPMVVFEARKGRLHAIAQTFGGFDNAGVDVLLVGDDAAFAAVDGAGVAGTLPTFKEQVRQGGFICYLLRVHCDLVEAGYEDVLQSMGIVFMGACR